MRRALAVAVVVGSLVAEPVGAEVLCGTHTGRVFLRARCKRHEVRVDLPKGPTGDEGAAARAPVRIVDSAGREIGLLGEAETEELNFAVFEVGSRLVSLGAVLSGFRGSGQLYHLAADCSDPPLVPGRRAPFVRSGVVVGTTAYYAEDPVEMKTPVARQFPPEDACFGGSMLANGNCCTTGSFGAGDYGPATVAFEVPSLGLTPPFHLEP
jgi:hypothetical protein